MTHAAQLGDRRQFPDLVAKAYTNHAAISPPSLAVREVARKVMDHYAKEGVNAHMPWLEQRDALQAQRLQQDLPVVVAFG